MNVNFTSKNFHLTSSHKEMLKAAGRSFARSALVGLGTVATLVITDMITDNALFGKDADQQHAAALEAAERVKEEKTKAIEAATIADGEVNKELLELQEKEKEILERKQKLEAILHVFEECLQNKPEEAQQIEQPAETEKNEPEEAQEEEKEDDMY